MNKEPGRGGVAWRQEEIRETKWGQGNVAGGGAGGGAPRGRAASGPSSLALPPTSRRHPTQGGPLGLGKGGPLPMCCVSSCTAGISFRGMCPVPPSLQHRRQQNTEAAITQGPPTSPLPLRLPLPPVALTPRRHTPPPEHGRCVRVERGGRYSDALGREGAAQAEVKLAWAEERRIDRWCRAGPGPEDGGARGGARGGAGRDGRDARPGTACACALGRFPFVRPRVCTSRAALVSAFSAHFRGPRMLCLKTVPLPLRHYL